MADLLESLPSTRSCTAGVASCHYVPAETGRNDDADKNFVFVDGALDRGVGVGEAADFEVAGALELARHLAADGGTVLVVYQGRDVVHIQAQRVAVQQEHHKGHRQRQRQAAAVPRYVMQFLDEDCARAPEAHAIFFSSASIRATNTSSRDGRIFSSL